ncbi:MAG: hypothetical protein EOP81_14155 [Variovorax sp.]|nr:MAG: hypothetical protein EOP81_14155 [Variovorax sp.]
MGEDDLHLTRLSPDQLHDIALSLRLRALRGDANADLVAAAIDGVVRRRRAAARMQAARRFLMRWRRWRRHRHGDAPATVPANLPPR